MSFLFWGTIILFLASIIFYIVFFWLIYYWHEKKTTVIVVPLLFTFEFFMVGFLIMLLGVLVVDYFPQIAGLF